MTESENLELLKLGHRLRKYRQYKNYSQEKLAELSCLDRTYISSLERGQRNPSFLILRILSEILCINPNQLFEDE